jgi:hypothetical protein
MDDSELREVWDIVYSDLLKIAIDEEPKTSTVGLPEPLKVRVITKGPPVTYFCLKQVQKFLWSKLKNHPTFRLIGQPLTEEIVNEVFKDHDQILSGDYKASTDNIYSWLSEYTCKKVFECLRRMGKEEDAAFLDQIEILTKRGLTGHWIANPKFEKLISGKYRNKRSPLNDQRYSQIRWLSENSPDHFLKVEATTVWLDFQERHKDIEPGRWQKQGQLMGSVVSFPFLCIINCAVCWYSMSCDDPTREHCSLRGLKLLINGDDCVFTGTEKLMEYWEKCIQYVGFSSSVGKTYFSKELLVMNSMTFFKNEKKKCWEFKKYINFGLLGARNKAGEVQKNVFAYQSIQKDLMEKTPSEHIDSVNKMFFRNHINLFKKTGLPFYMPQWSGGLGLLPPPDHSTYHDRLKLSSRIKSGEVFKPPPIMDEWKIDKALRDKLKEWSPLLQTYDEVIMDADVEIDLTQKEWYAPMLCSLLLCHHIDEYHDEIPCFIQCEKLNKYIQQQRKRWEIEILPEIRVRSFEELTERYEPKKNLALLRMSASVSRVSEYSIGLWEGIP